MKYIIVVPDGAADYPCEELKGKSPLEVANTPNMDYLSKQGIIGRVRTVPKGLPVASDVANLSLLGYDPKKYYTGRGPLEAANMGLHLEDKDVVFRCNLVTGDKGKLIDYSSGHITNKESHFLIEALNKELASKDIHFYPGVSYRNLMVVKNGYEKGLDDVKCFPPHDILGNKINKYLPQGKASGFLKDIMEKAQEVLSNHEINSVRVDLKENPANMIWLWGQGIKPSIPLFKDTFGKKGAIISAVDLIKGIGKIIGFKVLEVEGATGYYDTNYEGKADATIEALEDFDFVYTHIEATDEAGHNGDLRMKITCLERIDKIVLGKILQKRGLEDTRLLVVPDHFTPFSKRTHSPEPVPLVFAGKGIPHSITAKFSEEEAQRSDLYFDEGPLLMNYLLKQ